MQQEFENKMKQKTDEVVEVLKGSSFYEIEWILIRVKNRITEIKESLSLS